MSRSSGRIQRGQEHARQDCDYGYSHKKLYKGEFTDYPSETEDVRMWRIFYFHCLSSLSVFCSFPCPKKLTSIIIRHFREKATGEMEKYIRNPDKNIRYNAKCIFPLYFPGRGGKSLIFDQGTEVDSFLFLMVFLPFLKTNPLVFSWGITGDFGENPVKLGVASES